MALGVLPRASFREIYRRLTEDEALFLYTDGVTEAFDRDGNLYGLDRLLAEVEAHAVSHPPT